MYNSPTKSNNIFTLAHHYMKMWPKDTRLLPIFPESRIIPLTQLAIKYVPPLACFILVAQVLFNADLGPTIATTLFACCLPVQGLYWLGLRSKKTLPIPLIKWLNDVQQKLSANGIAFEPVPTIPTYMDLAYLLNIIFNQTDNHTFIDTL